MTGDLSGVTILVTGANSGIGRATAEALAARGATLYLACRSESRARPVMAQITETTGNDRLSLLTVDLADLASVRACADAFLQTGAPLHVLVNNAGLAGSRGTSASGFELAFGTNHVGPVPVDQPAARPAARQRAGTDRHRRLRRSLPRGRYRL